MPPFQLSQSPRTQGFQIDPGPQEEDELFTKGFSDLAYRAINKSNPDLMGSVITFRVLDTDASAGMGVGAFILKHEQDIVFIPCVVSDNTVKPLDMFYSRRLDRFYPLSREWLQEASKGSVNQLGTGIKPPKGLATDVDIRNMIVPPTTGRYSYASAEDVPDDDIWHMYVRAKEAEEQDHPGLRLLSFLQEAPNKVKLAAQRLFKRHTGLAKTAAEFYGAKNLIEALQPTETKVADDHRKEVPMKHDLFVVTTATPTAEMEKRLGKAQAREAYKQVRLHGFYVKDERPSVKDVFTLVDNDLHLMTPDRPGIYKVFLTNGKMEMALIIPSPVKVRWKPDDQKMEVRRRRTNLNRKHESWYAKCQYLVLFKDGRHAELGKMLAEPVAEVSHEEVESFLKSRTKAKPSNKEYGVLVCTSGLAIRATERMYATDVSTNGDTTSFKCWGDVGVVINNKMHGSKIVQPLDSPTLVVSDDFRWFEMSDDKRLDQGDFYVDSRTIYGATEHALAKTGAVKVAVQRATGGFFIGGERNAVKGIEAVEKVARLYDLSVGDAAGIMQLSHAGLKLSAWAMPLSMKTAAGETLGDPNDPNNQPPTDPSAQQGGPPQPSGIDLALAEKMQTVQGQIAALQQMMSMLQELQGRAQGIDQGGGAMAAPMGAAAMAAGPGSVMGGPMMAPVPGMDGQGGGAPPQGGDPSQQGQPQQPPQGDPSQGGGMDPSQMGQMGPGNAQGMPPGPPPPPPVMTEQPTPENMESQINPSFMNEAASLQQDDVFDAAAIASLSQQKGVRELTQNYMPTLDRALDNLGRCLLLYYLKEGEVKESVGNDIYEETEQKLRDVFKGLGDAILQVNRSSDQMLPGVPRPT